MMQFFVAGFIMAVGLSIAGAGTHLYQGLAKEQAMLRYDGRTYLGTLGHLAMSFVCGPYIMLQLGWRHEPDGTVSVGSALLAALVAFGWAFITGLLFMGVYFSFTG
ncbi:MAG: DUF6949 family protein [Devosia sp.]|nr:hypothetical protein [Devosiaceae bacterium]